MIDIGISQETVNHIHAVLNGLPDADKKVLRPAMARGLSAARTTTAKEVKKTYHISQTAFKNNSFIKIKNVTQVNGGIIGSIQYSGQSIPLIRFNVTPKTPTPRKDAVTVSVKKTESPVKFNNAFIAQMPAKHTGVFERKGTWLMSTRKNKGKTVNTMHNEKIKELFGPSVPSMAGNTYVMDKVEARVKEVINKRIEHEIERLLNQNGGSL